jgi:hypothetical protein
MRVAEPGWPKTGGAASGLHVLPCVAARGSPAPGARRARGRGAARSLRTQLCLQYSAEQISVAALFLGMELLKLPQLRIDGREWWTLHRCLAPAQLLGAPRPLHTRPCAHRIRQISAAFPVMCAVMPACG